MCRYTLRGEIVSSTSPTLGEHGCPTSQTVYTVVSHGYSLFLCLESPHGQHRPEDLFLPYWTLRVRIDKDRGLDEAPFRAEPFASSEQLCRGSALFNIRHDTVKLQLIHHWAVTGRQFEWAAAHLCSNAVKNCFGGSQKLGRNRFLHQYPRGSCSYESEKNVHVLPCNE